MTDDPISSALMPHSSRDRASPRSEMSFCPFKKLLCAAQLGFQQGQIAQWRAASTRHHVHRASKDCLSAATYCPLHPSLPRSSLFRVSRAFYILHLLWSLGNSLWVHYWHIWHGIESFQMVSTGGDIWWCWIAIPCVITHALLFYYV